MTPTGSSGLSKAAKRNAQKKRAAKLKHAAKPESGEKPKPRAAKPSGASLPLAVVFEDDEVLAINKPAGLLCHPSPGFWDRGTVVHALPTRQRLPGFSPLSPEMLGERRSNTGEADSVIPRAIVHRLDRGTTGLMVLAKTARAEAHLAAQFKGRTTRKAYVALLHGAPSGGDRPPRQPGAPRPRPRPRPPLAAISSDLAEPTLVMYPPQIPTPGETFVDAPIGKDPQRPGAMRCDALALAAKPAQAAAPDLRPDLRLISRVVSTWYLRLISTPTSA